MSLQVANFEPGGRPRFGLPLATTSNALWWRSHARDGRWVRTMGRSI